MYSVRPHRFAFAPRWALAILYGEPLADELRSVLEDWMRFAASASNEMAYLSNLVVIQRVLALSCAWAFLAARPTETVGDDGLLEFRILQILCADIGFLAPRFGSSYPNNHLLLDRFAKWFCAAVWPEFISADSIEEDEHLWLAELQRQTLEDGAGFEHSVHYHEIGCEMAIAYLRLCQTNDWSPPEAAVERLRAMLRFQTDVSGPESIPLSLGNAIEDPLFPLDSSQGWGAAALREVYRAWFDSGLARARADDPAIERAFWLLGGKLAPDADPIPPDAVSAMYRSGGFTFLPDRNPTSRLTLRTGPAPGSALFAGHAHADLLSVYLTIDSTPIIVDAGTYTYRGESAAWAPGSPLWRRYFAGPRAHNGPAIANADPLGPLVGDFRSPHSSARVRMLRAHLDGPLRWTEGEIETAGPYTGWRRGVIHLRDEYWLVYDILPEQVEPGEGSFALQFPPEAILSHASDCRFSVCVGSVSVDVAASPELMGMRILKGETDPLGGWVSRSYGTMLAAPQVRFAANAVGGISAFVLKTANESSLLAVETAKFEGGYGLRVVHGDYTDQFLISFKPAPSSWLGWGIEFSGALARIRERKAEIEEFIWIEGQMLDCSAGCVKARDVVPMLTGRVRAGGLQTSPNLDEGIECVWRR